MKSSDKANIIQKRFSSFFQGRSEKQKIRHDEYMLMASFLSEFERVQRHKSIKRNKLAELIKTSASYLTQVFRGDKPLNFHTIAKMQRALDIRFFVKAYYKNGLLNEVFDLETPPIYIHKDFSLLYDYESLLNKAKNLESATITTTSNEMIN